jgi:hypothetical protein
LQLCGGVHEVLHHHKNEREEALRESSEM